MIVCCTATMFGRYLRCCSQQHSSQTPTNRNVIYMQMADPRRTCGSHIPGHFLSLQLNPTGWVPWQRHLPLHSWFKQFYVSKKFPSFYGTRKFIIEFTRARLNQMNPVHTYPPYFRTTPSNITFPPTPRSSKWSLPFTFSNQNSLCISHLSHVCYMHCPSLPP
jgi:hypothetical protein